MESQQPLVSVLMTAYNREQYIAEAIESVLESTYTNFELIVVDDSSTDATVSIARSYEAKDHRIKVYVNEKNLGDYPNRNKAAYYAQGKYLKYLDSDDKIYPWGLEAMVYCMEKFPNAGLGQQSYNILKEPVYPILISPRNAYRSFYFNNNLFLMGPSACIINRAIFEKLEGFNGEKYFGDQDLWLRLGALMPVVRMPMDLIWWRQHEGQQIAEEVKDKSVKCKRYKNNMELINHPNCPLNHEECKAVLKNLKNLRVRDIIINYLLKLKIGDAFSIMRQCNLSLIDLCKVLRRNTYPEINDLN